VKKTTKKAKSPAKSAKRKVAIKDLKAKDAASVKGGVLSNLAFPKFPKVEGTFTPVNSINTFHK